MMDQKKRGLNSSCKLPALVALFATITALPAAGADQQTSPPKTKPTNAIPAAQAPSLVSAPLTRSNIATNGAQPAVGCILYDNAAIIFVGNGNYIEVVHCDGTGSEPETGNSGGGGSAGAGGGSGTEGSPGVGSSPQDCSLFAQQLAKSCAGLPAALRATCQYDACLKGAQCEGASASQCGPKPKATSSKETWNSCFDGFAANFNACTGSSFQSNQNSCIYASSLQLNSCVTVTNASQQQVATPPVKK